MAWRSVSSFVSRDVDPRLSDAAVTRSTASLNFEGEPRPTTNSIELSLSNH